MKLYALFHFLLRCLHFYTHIHFPHDFVRPKVLGNCTSQKKYRTVAVCCISKWLHWYYAFRLRNKPLKNASEGRRRDSLKKIKLVNKIIFIYTVERQWFRAERATFCLCIDYSYKLYIVQHLVGENICEAQMEHIFVISEAFTFAREKNFRNAFWEKTLTLAAGKLSRNNMFGDCSHVLANNLCRISW